MLPHLIERYVYYAMIRLMIVTEKRESFKYVHSSLICECSRDLLGRRFVRRRGRCAFASLSRVPSVVSRKVKTMATLLWIIIGLLLQRALGIKDRCEAHATTARILENNEPQALILSGDEANSFISTSVHVSVSWDHIDTMLKEAIDPSVLDSYFVEYYLSKHVDDTSDPAVIHLPAQLKTEASIMIDDDCRLLSVVLGVMLNTSSLTVMTECSETIFHSRAKVVFPAARRTVVNIFSNRAEFLWPPGCSHVIEPIWQLESCRQNKRPGAAVDVDNCHRDSLKKESSNRYEVTDLEPCQLWHFRLRTAPTTLQGITTLGHVLWSYEAKTVPVPHVQVIAGHDYVRLILDQSKCANEAVIVNWRITVCEDWKTVEASNSSSNQLHCRNSMHGLTFFNVANNRGKTRRPLKRGYLQISNLKECQLYTVAITPTSSDGQPLLPGERFTSIHSTLCPPPPPPDIANQGEEVRKDNESNSELVVVLIVMVLIGSSMLCLALKSVSDINSGVGGRNQKQYYNPSYYDSGDYILESMQSSNNGITSGSSGHGNISK